MKIFNFVVVILGLILILQFAGFPTGMNDLLAMFGVQFNGSQITGFNFSVSTFFDAIFSTDALIGILATVGLAAIAIGTFAKGTAENFIILPFITGTLVLFVQSFIKIVNYAISTHMDTWIIGLISFIFIPATAGFVIACIEFFRGND